MTHLNIQNLFSLSEFCFNLRVKIIIHKVVCCVGRLGKAKSLLLKLLIWLALVCNNIPGEYNPDLEAQRF
jgi:hypothetical protein